MKNLFNNDLNQTELFKQPANNENFDEIERVLNSKREQRVYKRHQSIKNNSR